MSPPSWTSFPPLSHPQSIISMIDFINILCFSCAVLCLIAQSCPTLCTPMDCSPPGSCVHGDSLGKNTEAGCRALLQRIFPTQGSRPGVSIAGGFRQGRPRVLEWVSHPFSGTLTTRKSTRGLLNPRQILYQLSYLGSSLFLLCSFVP